MTQLLSDHFSYNEVIVFGIRGKGKTFEAFSEISLFLMYYSNVDRMRRNFSEKAFFSFQHYRRPSVNVPWN